MGVCLNCMNPERPPEREVNWQGQVKSVPASELKPGVVYIDRNKANFAPPKTDRNLLILAMNPRGDTSQESKAYELVARDERGNIVHPSIVVSPDSYFDIIEQTK